jgi:SecD/SecF fusion protein
MVELEMAAIGAPSGTPFELSNPDYQPGSSSGYKTWTLETMLPAEDVQRLTNAIQAKIKSTPVFPSSNEIGGKVAGDTQQTAIVALTASCIMIAIYVWIRFQNVTFGVAAVIALIHDVLVTVAFLAMSAYLAPFLGFLLVDPFKISLPVVAALLTIVGFSINDTIVVFDRIREIKGKSPEVTDQMVNDAVNQTLSRTILTSGTVIIATVILYTVGGQPIHAFAYSMLVGCIAGTYSSVYIAAPIVLWMRKSRPSPAKRVGEPVEAGARR